VNEHADSAVLSAIVVLAVFADVSRAREERAMTYYQRPVHSTVLGYPRIGADRALKKATESYWRGQSDATDLEAAAARIRIDSWMTMRAAGIDELPVNDFSYYDQLLDTAVLVGAVPRRFSGIDDDLERYFAMARGDVDADVVPLEMTKWFDTNYHYLVPELDEQTAFTLDPRKPLRELAELFAALPGVAVRPVFIGPVTFLLLAKPADDAAPDFEPLSLIGSLVPIYQALLAELAAAGAGWVQLDEPVLAMDQPTAVLDVVRDVYCQLGAAIDRPKILVASYFDTTGAALPILSAAPIEGIALDLTRGGASQVGDIARLGGLAGKRLVAGVVDGRNVWINDLQESLSILGIVAGLADEVVVSSSCSLQHVPLDLGVEHDIDPQVSRWLAFARQKLDEVVVLGKALHVGVSELRGRLEANRADLGSRRASPITHDPAVRERSAALGAAGGRRDVRYPERAALQSARFGLPPLPTTTIGSFPQTASLRAARAALSRGALTPEAYEDAMRDEISRVIALQLDLGIDVLVHGEPERNDMVQYFAEQLDGVLVTKHGWVQSYGTRYVRPPIIAGDVSRPRPMTVKWSRFAQSMTVRPVKGMLTGPVTMLCWSFVRDDQPLAVTGLQMALALRDEVIDLEAAGLGMIQVDEPALREGLPLRSSARAEYLAWATEAFRVATSSVRAETQIHTHMCYAEFGEVMDAIVALDADVISLEAARSRMAVVSELAGHYPAAVGPGVYDIHSPRTPSVHEAAELIGLALQGVPAERLWINPDCGLKTRTEDEAINALRNVVAAAVSVRSAFLPGGDLAAGLLRDDNY
jgi:5-methyltetrahydropteroyltriglutamate--homocysteine methyltransferase